MKKLLVLALTALFATTSLPISGSAAEVIVETGPQPHSHWWWWHHHHHHHPAQIWIPGHWVRRPYHHRVWVEGHYGPA